MFDIKGVLLKLKSENEHKVDNDDRFYVGVCGRGKAKEFHFDVYGYDDFNAGTDVKCRVGEVWEDDLRANGKEPYKVGSSNNTTSSHIDLDKVNRVYLRKQSHSGENNVWELNGAEVILYGSNSSQKRKIYKGSDFGPVLEHGLKVWLTEQ